MMLPTRSQRSTGNSFGNGPNSGKCYRSVPANSRPKSTKHFGFNMFRFIWNVNAFCTTIFRMFVCQLLPFLRKILIKFSVKFSISGALRLLRRIIGLKDDIYIKHICDKGILDLVVDCFVANGTRYNLLNSSLIELFEYIRTVCLSIENKIKNNY